MTETLTTDLHDAHLEQALEQRTEANRRFFETHADRLALLCHAMSERFARGGRLIAHGRSPAARSDARHVAVEFVHPVIVGKRALPALALTDGGEDLSLIARETDIVIAFDDATDAVNPARKLGCLTIAFEAAGAEWELEPPVEDPYIRQELVETVYHLLWELVHVFFEHRASARQGAGPASFLYPFLSQQQLPLEPVLDDVSRSVRMKANEIGALRAQTLIDNRRALLVAACDVRASFDRGGTLLALGNGGSATDAMDAVADFRSAGRRAIDLAEDPAILTAIANDIGTEAIFSRQVIAYAQPGDVLLAISTSGNSDNVIAALSEARRRRLVTIAMVGYDGGRVAQQRLADHVIVTRSQHIPRIQEAQASAYHVLRELVELVPAAGGHP